MLLSIRALFVMTLLAAGVTAACGGSAPAVPAGVPGAEPVDPAAAGTLTGRVLLDGVVPDRRVVRLYGDPTCVQLTDGEVRLTEDLLVGDDHTVRHALVYVKTGLEHLTFPIPGDPVMLDQQKCRYEPRVVGVRVGQPLVVRNSDPLLHNVRSDSAINAPFNMAQPVAGLTFTRVFSTREVMVPVKCDLHPWMQAWIGVLEHPFFAVTDPEGRFTLPGLPPGTYTLEAWHERLGTQTQHVTIGPQETKDVTFTFEP